MTCKTMKQNENDQNHKKESTPVVDDKPNGPRKRTLQNRPYFGFVMSIGAKYNGNMISAGNHDIAR